MSQVFDVHLPAGWRTSRLKQVTSLLNRGSAPNYVDVGEVRAISQAANQGSGLDWSRTRYHSFAGNANRLKGHLRPRDVLINSTGTGTLGRIGFFEGGPDDLPCMADGHVTVARFLSDEIYPRFGYYWLSCRPFQDFIYAALIVGATNQIELNADRLADAPIPIPSWDEQRRIADFLDAETAHIGQLVSNTQRLRFLAAERSGVVFTESLQKHTGYDASNALDIQDSHNVAAMPLSQSLKQLTNGYVGPTRDLLVGEGVPYIQSLHIKGGTVDFARRPYYVPLEWAAERPRIRLAVGDILIVQTGAVGQVALVDESAAGASCHALLIARTNRSIMSPEYLYHALLSTWGKQALEREQTGALHPHLEAGKVREIRIPTPALEVQGGIVKDCLASMQISNEIIAKTDAQILLLNERRQAIITAAVTGQFDVTTGRERTCREF